MIPNFTPPSLVHPSWRHAVDAVLDHCMDQFLPFTSGEVVALVRTHWPDFRFSHADAGEYIRTVFEDGGITYGDYDASRVTRVTTGVGKTPAGVSVYVYAPSVSTALSHDFELTSPATTVTTLSASTLQPRVTLVPTLTQSDELVATVHSDRRVLFPRTATSQLRRDDGTSLREGDPVWVVSDTNSITLFPEPMGNKKVLIGGGVRGKGRVRVSLPEGVTVSGNLPITVCDQYLKVSF